MKDIDKPLPKQHALRVLFVCDSCGKWYSSKELANGLPYICWNCGCYFSNVTALISLVKEIEKDSSSER